MLIVAIAGVVVNLVAARILARGSGAERSLNVEGSYRHILTDLYGFIATAVAAIVILATGFSRADAIASLIIAGLLLHAAYGLLHGLRPRVHGGRPGRARSRARSGASWPPSPASSRSTTCTSGRSPRASRRSRRTSWCGPAMTATSGAACLQQMVPDRFGVDHTTLQVDHEAAPQPPLQIEVPTPRVDSPRDEGDQARARIATVPRGVVGGAEISQTTADAHNIYMGRFRVPPGARSLPALPRGMRERRLHAVRQLLVRWGDRLDHELELAPGDMVYVPPRETHVLENTSDTEAAEYVVARDSPHEDAVVVPWATEDA